MTSHGYGRVYGNTSLAMIYVAKSSRLEVLHYDCAYSVAKPPDIVIFGYHKERGLIFIEPSGFTASGCVTHRKIML